MQNDLPLLLLHFLIYFLNDFSFGIFTSLIIVLFISNKLNELLIKNYDAEKGYINAMKEVDNVNVKNFFKKWRPRVTIPYSV